MQENRNSVDGRWRRWRQQHPVAAAIALGLVYGLVAVVAYQTAPVRHHADGAVVALYGAVVGLAGSLLQLSLPSVRTLGQRHPWRAGAAVGGFLGFLTFVAALLLAYGGQATGPRGVVTAALLSAVLGLVWAAACGAAISLRIRRPPTGSPPSMN